VGEKWIRERIAGLRVHGEQEERKTKAEAKEAERQAEVVRARGKVKYPP